MLFIADFHLHSKYSRATSGDMDLEHLNLWGKIKGIQILGTADFTHPAWFNELKEKLVPGSHGLFKLKNQEFLNETKNQIQAALDQPAPSFILTTEISCIYRKNNQTRRIHLIIFAPDLESVEKINAHLGWIGNLKADGRPILGLDAKELVKIVLEASNQCLVVPAHIWTPWFSLFGSESGFDSMQECFEELTPQIYAIETGLSSNPAMNWRIKELDTRTIISNSDAHSPANLGREANLLNLPELSYQNIAAALKGSAKKKETGPHLESTIEFFPEEGKYHWDGHRSCDVRFSPEETKKHKNICPKCGRSLTVGVMNRVEKLANRKEDEASPDRVPYQMLVPLLEIIAEALGQTKGTKAVFQEYQNLIKAGKNEFNILLNLSLEEISKMTQPKIVEGIKRVRAGKLNIIPGYDGVYGTVKVFNEQEKEALVGQKSLF